MMERPRSSFQGLQGPLVYTFGFPCAHAAQQAFGRRAIGTDAFF
jgi:hypothetical protein